MKREFSAGGIVLRLAPRLRSGLAQVFDSEGGAHRAQTRGDKFSWEILLTQHSQNKHWSFPKGLIEEGHTTEETALREVKEEGGVEAEILGKIGYSKYVYTLNGEKIFKVVTYFVMKYLSGDPKDHDWEMMDAGWFSPDEALKKLSFSRDKQLLKEALELISKP